MSVDDRPGDGGQPAPQTDALEHRWRTERGRNVLLVMLTLVTGATDAIGFTRLGGVFTSVMTGNMVLLGVSGGRRDASLALHTGAAFAGYVAGSMVGARIAGYATRHRTLWPRTITAALVLELAVFGVFGVWWELAGGRPSGDTTYALLGINAVALGIQSSAVIRFGIPGLSTTYLTGTLTRVVGSLTSRHEPISLRSVAVLLALVGGAGLGAVLAIEVPRAAPAVPLGILLLVLAGALLLFHHRTSHLPQSEPVGEAEQRLER